jgi:hypothetical protein
MKIDTAGWEQLPAEISVQGRRYEIYTTNGWYHAVGSKEGMGPLGRIGLGVFDGNRDTCAVVFAAPVGRIALYWHRGRRDALSCFLDGESLTGEGFFYDTAQGITNRALRGYVDQAMRDLASAAKAASAH